MTLISDFVHPAQPTSSGRKQDTLQPARANSKQAYDAPPAEGTSGLTVGDKDHLLSYVAQPCRSGQNILTQASSAGLELRGKYMRQGGLMKGSIAPQIFKTLPHLPDDIGMMVLTEANVHLTPMTLMTLMNVEAKDNIPPFLAHVAWENKFWSRFSRVSTSAPDTSYAQAFLDRWNEMSAEHRVILENLWSTRSTPVETLENNRGISNNFDIVMAAVCKSGQALGYASCALRGDRDIVMAAVCRNWFAIFDAAYALRDDRDIVMAAVRQNGKALEATRTMRFHRDIVLAAVRQDGLCLVFAPNALANDREIVMAAVCQDGKSLVYVVSEALEGDSTIVMAAVCQNGLALAHAIDAFRDTRDIVIAAVSQNGRALNFASDALQDDVDIVMAAVSQNGKALEFASTALKSDRGVVMTAVGQCGSALEFASDALKNDRDIVKLAII